LFKQNNVSGLISATQSRTAHQPDVPDEHQYHGRALHDPAAEELETGRSPDGTDDSKNSELGSGDRSPDGL